MKKIFIFILLISIIGIAPAYASNDDKFSKTINIFKESPAVEKFFNNCYGYAVFPTVGKAGFVIGGSFGKGQVYRQGIITGKVKLVEGSIGFQLGGKAFSEIIFLQDKRAYDEFTSGQFEFDAQAQVTVITAGAQAQAGTAGTGAGASAGPKTAAHAETKYFKGMATFIHSKGGLMYEASISGQKFKFKPVK
jgi:lipid-binding SYLF domain-containing protein